MSHISSVHKVNSGYLPELQIGATMVNSLLKGMTSTEVYHKTEYFLKQAQTVPMEFAGELQIGATMVNSLLKGMTSTEVYHKTEYFLKQAQPVPMEFAGHVSGLN